MSRTVDSAMKAAVSPVTSVVNPDVVAQPFFKAENERHLPLLIVGLWKKERRRVSCIRRLKTVIGKARLSAPLIP